MTGTAAHEADRDLLNIEINNDDVLKEPKKKPYSQAQIDQLDGDDESTPE